MSLTKNNLKIFEQVKDIVVQQLCVEQDLVTIEANLANDLGADSLDTVELIMAIEEKFDIEISDETAEQIRTINEVVEFIEKTIISN
uniref:Acyl carrier protein n=1 Tax=Choreocolax polysiphoniae TaxID=282351 RepID=A0A0B5VQE0_9FLOR|nr:acyl carrier protein [Choreocolax polysiphoniae]AJH65827.1 acyl carrier protein [Choreocolax polysiphoniae]